MRVAITISSCSVNYELSYDTYLENSEPKGLRFQDDSFIFNFIPVSNGIFFSINNLTDTTAFLIWDKSYFIEPDGNSYKAINLDLLKVEDEIVHKELNEELNNINHFIKENDKLGLGFAIKINDVIHDYQFNFKLKEIKVYEISKNK